MDWDDYFRLETETAGMMVAKKIHVLVSYAKGLPEQKLEKDCCKNVYNDGVR